MTAIETVGLSKQFGGITALEDLDLVVEEGEAFGFLGPNGAGKSTTINLLLDFVSPSSGQAKIFGREVSADSAVRTRIGVLPEGIDLYGELTAREHLEATVRMKDAADSTETLLRTVGIEDAADRRVGGFSTGMKQRLALGIALVGDPDLLILDEPSSGLDPGGVQLMRTVLRERVENGTTVFFSSHILSEVDAICDRVGVLNDGTLVANDTIDGLRRSSGAAATVTFTLTPDSLEERRGQIGSLGETIDGVRTVTVDELRVEATVADGQAKMDVIQRVNEIASVTNVDVEEPSLQSIFTELTDDSSSGEPMAVHGEGSP